MKFILSLLITGVHFYCCAQIVPDRTLDNSGPGWMNDLILTDHNGQPFKLSYEGVQGSPYFLPAWKTATIFLNQGKKFEKIKTRIDLYAQEAHFITANDVEAVTPNGLVTSILLFDSTAEGEHRYLFKTGYPAIDNQNTNNFYLVLADGPLQLLQSIRKKINEKKDDISNQTTREFDTYTDYYYFTAGGIKKFKKDKAFILELLSNQKTKVEEFIQKNNTSFRNIDSIVKLFLFYNSL
jgi:hypothetical protein